MRRARRTLVIAAIVLLGSGALTWTSPVEAGGGWPPVVLATGGGLAEPTVLDTTRSASLLQMLNHNGALRVLSAGEAVTAGSARIDLWVFQQYVNTCPPATFTYRAECAQETIAYYPAIGDDGTALFVRGGVTFEAGPLLLVMLGDLGLPTRIELPVGVEVVASGLEVRAQVQAQRPGYDRVVRAGGGLAVAIGAVLVGGAMASVVGVRVPRGRARETQPVLRVASLSGSPRA